MNVAVVLPFRAGCAHRAANLMFTTARYVACHPEWSVAIADTDGLWSKARAVNDVVARLDAEVLVIADVDVVYDASVLTAAVDRVAHGVAPWVVPHLWVARLDQPTTELVRAGDVCVSPFRPSPGALERPVYDGRKGGGLFVVSRAAYLDVGGFDERFVGWAGEDTSIGWAFDTLIGAHHRMGGDLWHLWHPHDRHPAQLRENRALERAYQLAAGRRSAMLALAAENPAKSREICNRG